MTWTYNAARRRFEDLTTGPSGPRVLRALVDPTADQSDLAQAGVPVMPVPDEVVAHMAGGSPDDVAALNRFFTHMVYAHAQVDPSRQGEAQATGSAPTSAPSAPASAPAPGRPASADISGGQGYGGMLSDAQTRIARAEQSNLYLDWLEAGHRLDQAEAQMRAEMMRAGVDPGYYFGAAGTTAPAAATGAPQVDQRFGVAPDATGIRAQTAEDAVTGRATALARTQALARIAQQWEAQKDGAAWLEKARTATHNLSDLRAQLEWNTAHARGDSPGLHSMRLEYERAARDLARMNTERNPRTVSAAPAWTPASASASAPAPSAPLPAPGPPDAGGDLAGGYADGMRARQPLVYARGGQLPRYDSGGYTSAYTQSAPGGGDSGGGSGAGGAAGVPPPSLPPAPEPEGERLEGGKYQYAPMLEVAKTQAADREFANQMARLAQQRDAEIARIVQAAQARLEQMQVAHTQALAQIQAGVPLVEREVARRRATLEQNRQVLAGQHLLAPFQAGPGVQPTAWA